MLDCSELTTGDAMRRGSTKVRMIVAGAALAATVSLVPIGEAVAAPSESPGQACADGNWFPIEYTATYAGATGSADGTYLRRTPTRGGCASSWAHGDGQLSTAAIVSQCRTGIEPRFGPYPITLRFAQTRVLETRADCVRVMSGIAHGEIDPGRAPLFPSGS